MSFLASAGVRTGVAPLVTTCFRPPHRGRRIHPEDLADDEPVAEHADRGQVLLHGRGRPRVRPDVGRDVKRRHGGEASRLAPTEKLPHGPPVRGARPLVRDPPREELQEPLDGIPPPASTITCGSSKAPPPLSVTADVAATAGTSASAHSDTSPPPPTPPSTSSSNRS